jgi:hypothetical protein
MIFVRRGDVDLVPQVRVPDQALAGRADRDDDLVVGLPKPPPFAFRTPMTSKGRLSMRMNSPTGERPRNSSSTISLPTTQTRALARC